MHYGDYPTAAEWISHGEVLLTSGYAVGDLDAAAESTVVALVAAGCTALGTNRAGSNRGSLRFRG